MKVVIDAHLATTASRVGYVSYIKGLVSALLKRKNNGYILTYFDKDCERGHAAVMRKIFENAEMLECNTMKYTDLFSANSIYNEKSYPKLFELSGDVYHFVFQSLVPPLFSGIKIVTVHDTLNIDPSMCLKYHVGKPEVAQQAYFKLNALNPDVILADSEHTKQAICELNPIWENRTSVVYLGFDDASRVSMENYKYVLEKLKIKQPYLLFMGSFYSHKNIDGVIRAFGVVAEKYKDLNLVLVGAKGTASDEIIMSVVRSPYRARVHVTGVVSDEERQALFTGAEAFVFPTKHEGFGLPILEAQAFGIPLITSNTTACPEVAGDGAVLVDPYKDEEIADAIERVLGDSQLRKDLIRKGHENTKRFSWDKCAAETEEVYKIAYERGHE